MKLIIKQYLASLKERNELDAILPDLLSELGLNVFSRPGRGTRQYGVDVAAVGNLDRSSEKVYLFSIKAGDLTRNSWDGNSVQSLRPSLNEIMDTYIPNFLPDEYKNLDISICLCFGGDIQEQVRPQIEGYIKRNKKDNLTFEEWNGDKLASYILKSFLREDLLPENIRSQLRKSLALLDEPEVSYRHFSALLRFLSCNSNSDNRHRTTAIRQIIICLWIIFSWARDMENIESAYLSSELAVLYAWDIAKEYTNDTTKESETIKLAFSSILDLYQLISLHYRTKIFLHSHKLHALSIAVQAQCNLDINLKLFDLLGRLAISGLWSYWKTNYINEDCVKNSAELHEEIQLSTTKIRELILNNPILNLPIKDEQIIDISLAVLLLLIDKNSHSFIKIWLTQIIKRVNFTHKIQGQYPCTLSDYSELLEHPLPNNTSYFQEVTSGSILLPMIALFASLLQDYDLYSQVQYLKITFLEHCDFQFWYPDEDSENHFYTNDSSHGTSLSHVCIDRSAEAFMNQAVEECKNIPYFDMLSANKMGLWPLILIACRHYRLPVPLHLIILFSTSLQPDIAKLISK